MPEDYSKLLEIVRVPVESSNIAAIAYDEAMRAIVIEFKDKNSSVYAYPDCDRELFEQLETAESIGKFFNQKIKNVKSVVPLT
jgi:7-cyano-7-deazaguanine synthase in queuosine biosynthesis